MFVFFSEKVQTHAGKNIRIKQKQKQHNKLFFVFSVAFCIFVLFVFVFFSKVWFPRVFLVCFLLFFFKRVIYRMKLDPVDTTKYVSIRHRRQHTTASNSKAMQRNFNFWIREVGPRSLQNFARRCSFKISLHQTLLGSTAPWLRKSTLLSWKWTSTTSTLGLFFRFCIRDAREVSLLSTQKGICFGYKNKINQVHVHII